jgi:HEAT repeats
VTKPSKAGVVFLVFFGLMFLIPGLLAFYTFLSNVANKSTSDTIAAAAISLFMAAIGAGLILLAVYGNRRLRQQVALQEANPTTPWLWRTDWSLRRAESKRKYVYITHWVVCILCNMVIIPIAVSIALKPGVENNPGVFVAIGLSVVGLILLFVAVRSTLRRRRFGDPYFEFDSLPFSPGGRVSGRIQLKLQSESPCGVDVRLTCVRQRATGSGEDRTTVRTVLWQTGETVPPGLIAMDSVGTTIPINFAIPSDVDVTSHQNPSDQVLWILHAAAKIPGLKYSDQFELPVFSTSPAGQSANALQTGSFRVSWGQSSPQSRASTIVSFVVFAVFVAAVFAWQGWRFSTFKAAASAARANADRARAIAQREHSATSGAPAIATISVPHRAGASGMSDADAERVLALPAQQQAEELLERAIEHDPRALDLFEQNVGEWVGHIRLTDKMRQLERRSEFSNDLRVRYANADINLTLDGWQKNDEAADMLIARAKTDLQYRAAAVYFLGMLAGRGVAYDKIHPVLLDYAKHDPDATVRQWAVEGMRYLGKSEALDELFESFTQDPANNVRDRAGCNISDCGNFTRLQRMRMVPKFLDLISNPETSAQMKMWSYMALREITDANVPSDPQAWKAWYGQHGAGKLAEFERLDWWKVRGDE